MNCTLDKDLIKYWNNNKVTVEIIHTFLKDIGLEINSTNTYLDDVAYIFENKRYSGTKDWNDINLNNYIVIIPATFQIWQYKYSNKKPYLLTMSLQRYWKENAIKLEIKREFINYLGLECLKYKSYTRNLAYTWDKNKKDNDPIGWMNISPENYNLITKEQFEVWYQDTFSKKGWYLSNTLISYWNSKNIPLYYKEAFLKSLGLSNQANMNFLSTSVIYGWKLDKTQWLIKETELNGFTAINLSDWFDFNNSKKEEKHENRLQKQKTQVRGGNLPEGCRIKGRTSKVAVGVGSLSYKAVKS